MTTRTLVVEGMHCQACVSKLTTAFKHVTGVHSATVTLSPPRAILETTLVVPLSTLTDAAKSVGDYSVKESDPSAAASTNQESSRFASEGSMTAAPRPSLFPLLLIIGYILTVAALGAFVRSAAGLHGFMLDFMAGFFLVFSFFKMLDLRGFADAYQSYDILARRSRAYALTYPFIELGLGVAYLLRWQLTSTNIITLVAMLVGAVGVLRAVLDKRAIRCACLGTSLNLPMTTITVVEDVGMAGMALIMLFWRQ